MADGKLMWNGVDRILKGENELNARDRRKRLIIKCYRKEGISTVFFRLKTLTERKETDNGSWKNTHQPPLLLKHPHPPQQKHSERPDPQQAPAGTVQLHQLIPAKDPVHSINHPYPEESINPKNKSLLIMCHPASLLCLSPKMSSLAEHKAELSQAAAHLAERRAHRTITGNKRLSLTFPLFGSTCNTFSKSPKLSSQ